MCGLDFIEKILASRKLSIPGDGRSGEDAAEIPVGYTPSAMHLHPRTNSYSGCAVLFCAAACSLISAAAFAQDAAAARPRAAAVLDAMPHAKKIDQVAISPDGNQVAYIVNGELNVIPAAGGTSHGIAVEGKLPLRDATWSADGKSLAFIADLPGEIPAAQLWTAGADGGALRKLAELKGYVQTPRFSPEGSRLAVLFIEGMPRVAGPLQPMTPLAGVVDQEIFEERIATVDLDTGRVKQITPANMYVYDYDWTPDGKGWAATAAQGSGDANWVR